MYKKTTLMILLTITIALYTQWMGCFGKAFDISNWPCDQSQDCGSDYQCLQGLCKRMCQTDKDCNIDQACKEQLCVKQSPEFIEKEPSPLEYNLQEAQKSEQSTTFPEVVLGKEKRLPAEPSRKPDKGKRP